MMLSKARLAMTLSELKVFENPNAKEEQYSMDSEIGAEVLWNAYMNGDIEGKTVADLGCGTGILGIGALLLGAQCVFFVERDPKVILTLKENLETMEHKGEALIVEDDVKNFNHATDTIVQNPPFGTREKHADRMFLEKAVTLAPIIYTFHKLTSDVFLQKFSTDNGFSIAGHWEFEFPIKASQFFHKKSIHRIKVGCWKLVKQGKR